MDNPSAFPSVCLGDPCHPASAPGMTLRDWFAGQALAQMKDDATDGQYYKHIAQTAYRMADAMLAERGSHA